MSLRIKSGRVDFYNHNYGLKFFKFSIKFAKYDFKL